MSLQFINRLLNVTPGEWPRILLAWNLNLFTKIGFVIGWTVTIAMFINRVGIESLPYLFVLNALMIIIGTLLYSYLLQKVNRQMLMIYTVLAGGALLIAATLFTFTSNILFFGLILMAQSILLSQLNILIPLFTEDLFSPLESERTFPLIDTAGTFGGILGGLIIGLLSGILISYKFIYIWVLATLLIIPVLMTSKIHNKQISFNKLSKENTSHQKFHLETDITSKIKKVLKKIKKAPFLQGIILLVTLQFMLVTLVEFHYTKAVQESVLNREIHTLSIENEITKNLGILMMIFSFGSLMVQMLVASRLIKSMGIVGTFMLHPILTLINLTGLTINFNFFTAVLTRSNFEITSKLFHNAYQSSYYAVSENIRDYVKEFTDGFMKPIGTILAFTMIVIVQSLTTQSNETFLLNLIMVMIAVIMAIRLIPLKNQYTELSHQNLDRSKELPTRLNAIEILSQKGHTLNAEKLIKLLKNKEEKTLIKLKVLEALQEIKDPKSIPSLIDSMKNSHADIRLRAIEILGEFEELKNHTNDKYVFTRHWAIQAAKLTFQKEESSEVRTAIIQLLAKIDHKDLIPFIIQTLKEGDDSTKSACIRACKKFKDNSIIHYLQEYLDHKSPHVRAETIGALWPFPELRNNLNHYLSQMKNGKGKASILATLYTFGETDNKENYPYIFKQLASQDKEIAQEAAKTLSKLNHRASIMYLAEATIQDPEPMKKFTRQLSKSLQDGVENLVNQKISQQINEILEKTEAKSLMEMDESTLETLKKAYETVEEYEEAFNIEAIINHRKKAQKTLT